MTQRGAVAGVALPAAFVGGAATAALAAYLWARALAGAPDAAAPPPALEAIERLVVPAVVDLEDRAQAVRQRLAAREATGAAAEQLSRPGAAAPRPGRADAPTASGGGGDGDSGAGPSAGPAAPARPPPVAPPVEPSTPTTPVTSASTSAAGSVPRAPLAVPAPTPAASRPTPPAGPVATARVQRQPPKTKPQPTPKSTPAPKPPAAPAPPAATGVAAPRPKPQAPQPKPAKPQTPPVKPVATTPPAAEAAPVSETEDRHGKDHGGHVDSGGKGHDPAKEHGNPKP